jgi:hypothetical protein
MPGIHWRDKLKEDPVKFEEYKKKDRERAKIYRSTLNEGEKAKMREKARERVRKYREKKKVLATVTTDTITCRKKWTRNDEKMQETQREKWRVTKQKQRANYTAQKKRRILEKRRKQYREKKANVV